MKHFEAYKIENKYLLTILLKTQEQPQQSIQFPNPTTIKKTRFGFKCLAFADLRTTSPQSQCNVSDLASKTMLILHQQTERHPRTICITHHPLKRIKCTYREEKMANLPLESASPGVLFFSLFIDKH